MENEDKRYLKRMALLNIILTFVTIVVLIAAVVVFCTGCAVNEEGYVKAEPTVQSVQMEYSDFDLIVDRKTGIVYIDNVINTYKGESGFARTYHIYTPYYSERGLLCRFDDGKVVEVVNYENHF